MIYRKKPVSVIVPVALALLIVLIVQFALTGPENVVLPILISLSWQMSAYAVKVNRMGARTTAPILAS